MKICTILGARPQFVKAATISRAISNFNRRGMAHQKISEIIVHTGQHYDHNMSALFFEEMKIPDPDYHLNIGNLSHGAMTGQMIEKIEALLMNEKPDFVLVYGDTNSTMAGGIAASKLYIPVAHVEAGLRSFNRRMPEEINRVVTDNLSSYLFCPTRTAVNNLLSEGIGCPEGMAASGDAVAHDKIGRKVFNTGDVMLDAAKFYQQYASPPRFELPGSYILATVHRAENTDDPKRLHAIIDAFNVISAEIPIILPLHPRTKKVISELDGVQMSQNIRIQEPVGYLEMIHLLERSRLIMTDSGGLQKEAFFFQKPCITLRDETEWVELVEHGFNCLTGASSEGIIRLSREMIAKNLDFKHDLYGKGNAAQNIVEILMGEFS